MSKYNLFDDSIPENLRSKHEEIKAQTWALLEFSDIIADIMHDASLSQTELAKKLDVSRGYVSRLLSGSENISIKNAARILFFLGKKLVFSTENILPLHEADSNIYEFAAYTKNQLNLTIVADVQTSSDAAIQWCTCGKIG
jgi:transcriptional regulator with XRE-family HTH domain